jgi:hypothetical protein
MPPELALNPTDDDQKLLAQVIDYYQRALKQSAEAINFLHKRGITCAEALDAFRIGYADRTLGLTLPNKQIKAGKHIRTRLNQIGLYRGSGHEQFNGCVVFPITAADGSGRIVDIYGRKTGGAQLRKGTPLNMHLNDQRRGVWNVEALRAGQEMIVATSLLNALAFWCHGFRNVTCTFGPDALTDDHLMAFADFGVRRVLVCNEAIAPKLLTAGVEVFLLRFPPNVEANKYARGFRDPARALGAVIRRAEWIGKGNRPSSIGGEPVRIPQTAEVELDEADDEVFNEPTAPDSSGAPTTAVISAGNSAGAAPEPPPPPLKASPLPAVPEEVESEADDDELVMKFGNRRYRVRGLPKNLSFDQLKVNLLVSNEQGMFVDTFDLYTARHRRQFIAQAATELCVEENTIKKDLGRVLLKLEELQEEQISRMMEPTEAIPMMSTEEREAALQLLHDPNLLDRIVADFDVVGETTNKLVGYLAAISRKLDQPLAIIIQSSSAAGKTSLMEAVLAFVPPEEQVKYSAMTGQSLFYVGESDLKHKILAIVEEEGAERASYALKLLQSEGELMIASTGKNANTGRLVTHEYRVQGPVMIFLTTTAIKIDEELLNRCIILSVDENREQTKAIHQSQRHRQTLAGLLAAQHRQETLSLHRNAQRLLRPLLVANPYAESLTFLDDKTRTRRDHIKYLTLIRAIALLRQYQRPVKTAALGTTHIQYIDVALDDIAVANRLATEVLGRSADELPPQTRRLLNLIDEMVTVACDRYKLDRPDYRISRRDIREFTLWGHTQLKVHLKRLEELEYLLVHRGGRGQSFVYELLYEPPADASSRFLARLIDVEQLRQQYDGNGSAHSGQLSVESRPQVAVKSGRSRPKKKAATPDATSGKRKKTPQVVETANLESESSNPS